MKKLALLTAVMFAALAGSGFAQTAGNFGFGVELTGTGTYATNPGTQTIYALDSGGGSSLIPNTSPATFSSAWTSASTAGAPTFNLGGFVTGDTLTLNGGADLTFKNSGDNVSSSTLFYRITPGIGGSGAYTGSVNLAFNENLNNGNGDQRWLNEGANINLLTGLGLGTYTLSVYEQTVANSGSYYENNGGPDFGATFTVVPEPGTWAMMLGGLGVLVAFQRFRSRFTI